MSIIRFRSIHVIGPGLIGGSIGLACRRRGIFVSASSPYPAELRRARRLGAISAASRSTADVPPDADLVVIAAPVDAIPGILRRLEKNGGRRCTLTDTCSVKQPVVEAAARILADSSRFVGGHPMAGSERRGVEAARADLFDGARVVLTPTGGTRRTAVARVARFWTALGGTTMRLSPREHDRRVAEISHLPYVAAVALARLAGSASSELAAGGFRDTTRVAASDPALWAGILRANRREVVDALDRLMNELRAVQGLIQPGSPGRLRRFLSKGQRRREGLRSA